MRAILVYATSPAVLLGFFFMTMGVMMTMMVRMAMMMITVNGGHNLVHDDNKHNGKNPTLAGGRPPSAWQIIVMFVFSNTWESNKEDIEKRVV